MDVHSKSLGPSSTSQSPRFHSLCFTLEHSLSDSLASRHPAFISIARHHLSLAQPFTAIRNLSRTSVVLHKKRNPRTRQAQKMADKVSNKELPGINSKNARFDLVTRQAKIDKELEKQIKFYRQEHDDMLRLYDLQTKHVLQRYGDMATSCQSGKHAFSSEEIDRGITVQTKKGIHTPLIRAQSHDNLTFSRNGQPGKIAPSYKSGKHIISNDEVGREITVQTKKGIHTPLIRAQSHDNLTFSRNGEPGEMTGHGDGKEKQTILDRRIRRVSFQSNDGNCGDSVLLEKVDPLEAKIEKQLNMASWGLKKTRAALMHEQSNSTRNTSWGKGGKVLNEFHHLPSVKELSEREFEQKGELLLRRRSVSFNDAETRQNDAATLLPPHKTDLHLKGESTQAQDTKTHIVTCSNNQKTFMPPKKADLNLQKDKAEQIKGDTVTYKDHQTFMPPQKPNLKAKREQTNCDIAASSKHQQDHAKLRHFESLSNSREEICLPVLGGKLDGGQKSLDKRGQGRDRSMSLHDCPTNDVYRYTHHSNHCFDKIALKNPSLDAETSNSAQVKKDSDELALERSVDRSHGVGLNGPKYKPSFQLPHINCKSSSTLKTQQEKSRPMLQRRKTFSNMPCSWKEELARRNTTRKLSQVEQGPTVNEEEPSSLAAEFEKLKTCRYLR